MKDIKACLSHKTDDWRTPSNLYKAFMDIGAIDVCPFQSNEDLYMKVYKDSIIYMNPPFSELKKWLFYAQCLARLHNDVYVLMPVRTDTKYFAALYNARVIDHIYFFKGRLHFNDSKSAPFPSMLLNLRDFVRLSDIRIDLLTVEEFIQWFL